MSADQVVLHGTVRVVTFENDASGYRVLRLDVPGLGVQTVVGSIPRVAPHMELRVVGRRVVDPRFGAQIQADTVTVVTPSTQAGLERFLGSGLVRGLGPRLASRIVQHFGDDTLKVLDEGGDKLTQVKGISKKLAHGIGEAWNLQKHENNVLVFLQGHGVSMGLARKIFRRYGARTTEVVQETPFKLAMEVNGVGFLTADRIARSVGIARDAPERMEAGVVHCMSLFVDQGHTFAPRAELVDRASRELEAPKAPVDEAIDRVENMGPLVLEGDQGPGQRVYPTALFESEALVAEMLCDLLKAKGKELSSVDQAIAAFEKSRSLMLAPAQREAVQAAARSKVLVITGGPGVGKTTIVKAVLELFQRSSIDTRLCAPTGRAAKRLSESTGHEASTIHRLLEVDPRTGRFLRGPRSRIEAGAVVVDEVSMLDVPLARSLLEAIPAEARLLLVGDVDQLPSVGPGAVLRDVISSGHIPVVRLSTIFRQAHQSQIIESAHLVRLGRPPVSSPDETGDFFVVPRRDPEKARETVLKLVLERIPARFGLDPLRDVQILSPMRKGEVGIESLNDELALRLNRQDGPKVTKAGRTFRVGDKVMQLKNDYSRDVYNGDIGYVVSLEVDARRLVVRYDDSRDVEYDDEALDALSLAYAVSIHKSQGSEYPAIVVPWLRQHYVMLSRNLLYTAITRGKRLVVLVADPRAIEVALTEERREERRSSLAERLHEAVAAREP